MTNFEFYKEDILKFVDNDINFGLFNDKIVDCNELECGECDFCGDDGACTTKKFKWLYEEYIERPKLTEKEKNMKKLSFGFEKAIEYLKQGYKVARKGWNGKGMFLFLVFPKSLETKANVEIYSAQQSIAMRTTNSSIIVGWTASQTDMLAEDWFVVE